MKFKLDVQNRKIAWPTQRKFDKKKWEEAAHDRGEDDEDRAIAEAGLWVFETLEQIRREADSLLIWNMPTDERARYLLGLCNRDFIVANNMASSLPSDSMGRDITIILEERIYASSQDKWWGSQRLSNLLETGIDAANRCIDIDSRDGGTKSRDPQEQLSDTVKALNVIASYLAAEDCFHEVLWSDWRLRQVEDDWCFIPGDLNVDKTWEASCRRFSDIQAQTMSYGQHLWRTNAQLRENWLLITGGTPTFSLEQQANVISVKFAGRMEPSRLPFNFILETAVHEFYYQPLTREPLSSLNGRCLLDALKVFTLLGEISMQVMEGISDDSPLYSIKETTKFCPILLASSLASAMSEATDLKKKDVLRILKILTWRQKKSLWFHPLIEMETPKGPGYVFAAAPLVIPNIFWIVDYWLTNYGVAMEQRGRLFEQQIEEDVVVNAKRGKVEQVVTVVRAGEVQSVDKSSKEEIDVLILVNDLVVVAEAKCQTIPITPTDKYNYVETLKHGAAQAARKARWIKSNMDAVAKIMKVSSDKLSGEVQPIVLSNHPIGAGFVFDGVPVLDLRLLGNYFSQPYLKEARFTSKELRELRKGPRFYNGPREMADNFAKYAIDPDFLKVYLGFLKPNWIPLPIRTDRTVVRLQYLMDIEAVSASVC